MKHPRLDPEIWFSRAFADADEHKPQHILWADLCTAYPHVKGHGKLAFYILIMDLFGQPCKLGDTGDLGYYLKVVEGVKP